MGRLSRTAVQMERGVLSLLGIVICLQVLLLEVHAESPEMVMEIAYLNRAVKQPPVLSNIMEIPLDEGLQGARLAIQDNNAAGRFFKQKSILYEVNLPQAGDLHSAMKKLLDQGVPFIVANLPADELLRAEEITKGEDVLLFNIGASENRLREEECRANVFHTLPSRAMLADALAQFLVFKKWKRWFLISGAKKEDNLFRLSLKRAARRFGAKIVAEKKWTFHADMRRLVQQELPVFTQIEEDYDVLVVSDETGDFGEYLPYHTRDPRPVAGTQGLVPVAWHRVIEQWGAAQLQKRFRKISGRFMGSKDYAAWLAVRSLGEAVMRKKTNAVHEVRAFLLSEHFHLGGFKGIKLNYRAWNGQMRQPIPLIHPRSLVSQSPQEGFLHPLTTLDTLGFDRPESRCRFQ